MRILHFADLHIGVENYGRPATQTDIEALPPSFAPGVERLAYLGLSTRLLDFLCALDELVDVASREDVDLVLFSGDAYKSRDPSQTQQREFARRITTLIDRGIAVFLLVGNHDLPRALGRATAVDIFSTLKVAKVIVGDRLATHRIETKSGPLQVVSLPWVRRGAFLPREQHQGKPIDELTRYIEDQLTERLTIEANSLDPKLPAVLSAHLSVAGATTSSERSMMLGRDYVLQRSSVGLPAFDYVALGHVHRHQILGESPPMVYSGSLQRVDFSEEEDTKGFCIVDLDPALSQGSRASWEFRPVPARSFVTIDVEIPPETSNPTKLVTEAIGRRHIYGAVVRLRIRVPAELLPGLDDGAVRQALSPAHIVAPITREVVRERRPRLGSEAQGISPEDALGWYLDNRAGLDPETKREAHEKGLDLIRTELSDES